MSRLYDHVIATFDDSFQPTGTIRWGHGPLGVPVPHVEMKKLHHELHLLIDGPDGSDVGRCIQNAAVVGLIAAVVAAYVTGGAALPAAEGAFTAALEACLGTAFHVAIDNRSHWVTWDT